MPAIRPGYERLSPTEVTDAARTLDALWDAVLAKVNAIVEDVHGDLSSQNWYSEIEAGRRLTAWEFNRPIQILDRLRETLEALSDYQLLLAYRVNPSSGWKDLGAMTDKHPDALRKHFARLEEQRVGSLSGRVWDALTAVNTKHPAVYDVERLSFLYEPPTEHQESDSEDATPITGARRLRRALHLGAPAPLPGH